ncbi:MAG: Hsp20/alpha crystallin family protein [Chloroflexia bacterium]|nr:Hsp20/alpha crystallin family protein [Chloroflexia bacterium]
MANMIRWSPLREMGRMQSLLDRLMEESVYRPWALAREGDIVGAMPVDIYETAEEYVVKATLPGVAPENVDITFEAGVLTVRGEVYEEKEVEGECLCQERRFGKFARSVSLPGDVVADEIKANLADGVLTLRVPKAEETKPKKISISVS